MHTQNFTCCWLVSLVGDVHCQSITLQLTQAHFRQIAHHLTMRIRSAVTVTPYEYVWWALAVSKSKELVMVLSVLHPSQNAYIRLIDKFFGVLIRTFGPQLKYWSIMSSK